MSQIREMTLEEAKEIMQFLVDKNLGFDKEDLTLMDGPEWLSSYAYVVDDYITGGPGYAGKVYIILWDGSPAAVTTLYRMRDGTLAIGVMSDVDGNAEMYK